MGVTGEGKGFDRAGGAEDLGVIAGAADDFMAAGGADGLDIAGGAADFVAAGGADGFVIAGGANDFVAAGGADGFVIAGGAEDFEAAGDAVGDAAADRDGAGDPAAGGRRHAPMGPDFKCPLAISRSIAARSVALGIRFGGSAAATKSMIVFASSSPSPSSSSESRSSGVRELRDNTTPDAICSRAICSRDITDVRASSSSRVGGRIEVCLRVALVTAASVQELQQDVRQQRTTPERPEMRRDRGALTSVSRRRRADPGGPSIHPPKNFQRRCRSLAYFPYFPYFPWNCAARRSRNDMSPSAASLVPMRRCTSGRRARAASASMSD